jgi:predicted Zn-dependent protease with MMP-like domain
VRGDEREADEGGALGERADGDEGEGDEEVFVYEEERVDPCDASDLNEERGL